METTHTKSSLSRALFKDAKSIAIYSFDQIKGRFPEAFKAIPDEVGGDIIFHLARLYFHGITGGARSFQGGKIDMEIAAQLTPDDFQSEIVKAGIGTYVMNDSVDLNAE